MIELIEGPMGGQTSAAGIFQLPHNFNQQRWAAKWVEESGVPFARQREIIIGTNLSADGWEVWKPDADDNSGEEDDRPRTRGSKAAPTVVSDAKGRRYVLVCRPREIQDKVNSLYGNVSKQFINNEVTGKTVAAGPKQDTGMLTEQQLSGVRGQEGGGSESVIPLNRVEQVSATVET